MPNRIAALIVIFVLSVPAIAEENAPAPPAGQPVAPVLQAVAPPAAPNPLVGWEAALQKTTTFDFKETPIEDAVAFLQQLSGLNIVLTAEAKDEMEDKKVDLKLSDVPIIKVLEALAHSTGLALDPQPPIMYLTVKSDDVVGQLEISTDNVTITLDLTAQDLPGGLKRDIIDRALRNARQDAEISTRRRMMENMPPEAREKMKKAMENQLGEPKEKGRKKGEKAPQDAVAPQVF